MRETEQIAEEQDRWVAQGEAESCTEHLWWQEQWLRDLAAAEMAVDEG